MAESHRTDVPVKGGGGRRVLPFGLLLLLTAVGPLLLGGGAGLPAEGAIQSLGIGLYGVLAFLIAASTLVSGASSSRRRSLVAPGWAMAFLVLLGLAQLIPLPEGLLRAIAPVNVIIYHETTELLGLFGTAPGPAPRISIAPAETVRAVLALLTAVALFVAAAATANTRPRRRLVGSVLLAVAAIELAVSAARGTPGAFRGTFPDPDALAAILQICLAAAFARVWTEILTGRERALDAVGLSERFERRFPALAARLLIWALVAAGLLLTGSRAGILGAAAATVLAPGIGLLRLRGVDRRRTIWGACAVLAALLVGGFLGAFESAAGAVPSDSEPGRRATLSAWSEFRFAGSGFGTFREAFRRVQPPDLAEPVERAGSDVWGLAVTGGLAGVAGGALLLVASLGAAGVAWSRQRHREESATALAAWGAIAGLALQAAVGPGVFLPVAAGTLGVFLGAALGASEGA